MRNLKISVPVLLLTALAFFSAPLMAQQGCRDYPVLYSDDNFRGRSATLQNSSSDLHREGMGDDASSVCVPANWIVVLYEHTNLGGDVLELRGPISIRDLKRDRPQGRDWGDRISSVEVRYIRPPIGRGSYRGQLPRQCDSQPVLFQSDTFRGRSTPITSSVSDLHRSGMGDDASSVCVPAGWSITLYEDSNFRGDQLVLDGPFAIADLKRDRPDGRDWGDRISSVRVERGRRGGSDSGRNDRRRWGGDQRTACGSSPTIFDDRDYRGRSLDLDRGEPDLRRTGFGDNISSLCVPSGWTVVLYEYANYAGRSLNLRGELQIADLERYAYSSSFRGGRVGSIEAYRGNSRNDRYPPDRDDRRWGGDSRNDGPCRSYPVLYSNDGYRGRSLELRDSIRDLHREGMGDDASSVCVPVGWSVVLFENSDYRGRSLRLNSGQSISDLRRDRPAGEDWGDRISSVQVLRP